jgi:8-oxo-dGTP pyrophosphatase MutT (NUDIX family)
MAEISNKAWHEGVVRRSPNGNLWVAKALVTSLDSGRILLLRSTARHDHERAARPDFPGGYVDDFGSKRGLREEPIEAVLRETDEETGLPIIGHPEHIHTQVGSYSSSGLRIDIEYFRLFVCGEPSPQLNPCEHTSSWYELETEAPRIFGNTPFGIGMRAILSA